MKFLALFGLFFTAVAAVDYPSICDSKEFIATQSPQYLASPMFGSVLRSPDSDCFVKIIAHEESFIEFKILKYLSISSLAVYEGPNADPAKRVLWTKGGTDDAWFMEPFNSYIVKSSVALVHFKAHDKGQNGGFLMNYTAIDTKQIVNVVASTNETGHVTSLGFPHRQIKDGVSRYTVITVSKPEESIQLNLTSCSLSQFNDKLNIYVEQPNGFLERIVSQISCPSPSDSTLLLPYKSVFIQYEVNPNIDTVEGETNLAFEAVENPYYPDKTLDVTLVIPDHSSVPKMHFDIFAKTAAKAIVEGLWDDSGKYNTKFSLLLYRGANQDEVPFNFDTTFTNKASLLNKIDRVQYSGYPRGKFFSYFDGVKKNMNSLTRKMDVPHIVVVIDYNSDVNDLDYIEKLEEDAFYLKLLTPTTLVIFSSDNGNEAAYRRITGSNGTAILHPKDDPFIFQDVHAVLDRITASPEVGTTTEWLKVATTPYKKPGNDGIVSKVTTSSMILLNLFIVAFGRIIY